MFFHSFIHPSIHLPIDPYIHPPAHPLIRLSIHKCSHPSVIHLPVIQFIGVCPNKYVIIEDHVDVIPPPKEFIVKKPHPSAPTSNPIYQRWDPYQPLPAEHPRKDGIGINGADYVHRTPNIHLSRVLENSYNGSIWGRQGFGEGTWAHTVDGERRPQIGEVS